jgi:DNA invertase Pin-like site-specific DNA recombinase
MRAFGYVRLSRDGEDTTSPQRQRAKIEALCKERGWELLETFADIDESAFNGHRRLAYDQMLGRLGEAEAIVFWRPDRLARSVTDFSHLLDLCKAQDVHLVSTDYQIDTSSAMGKAFVQLTAVFAELESGNLSERSRQMMAHKREKGEWVGARPFGWRIVGKHLEQDEDEQRILRDIARRYVGGESINHIALTLGKQSSVINKILKSDRVHEALPDDLSGPLVEALLARKMDRVPTSRKSLLGGIATCAVCGGGLSLASSMGGRSEGKRWYSYKCPGRGHVGIAGPWLESFVTEAVLAYIDTDRLQEAIKRQRKTRPTRKVSAIEARLELLDSQYVEGKVSKARFDRMNTQLLEQLKAAQASERQRGIDLPVELARKLSEKWEGMPVSTRRRIIQAVVESITVSKAEGHGKIDPGRVQIRWRQ